VSSQFTKRKVNKKKTKMMMKILITKMAIITWEEMMMKRMRKETKTMRIPMPKIPREKVIDRA
jgi:hypothetical protein